MYVALSIRIGEYIGRLMNIFNKATHKLVEATLEKIYVVSIFKEQKEAGI